MGKEKKPDVVETSPMPGPEGVAGLVAGGAAIMRLENDTQMMIAVQRPRDEKKILEAALQELRTYPIAAEAAIYSKPVGKEPKCKACGADTYYKDNCPKCKAEVPQKFARGLSIRAAESLGNRWENSAYALKIASEDDDGAELMAVFLDYERNTRHHIPRRVSRRYKTKSGQMAVHRDDRFKSVILAAEGSKILREVILRSLPAGLKEEYRQAAEQAVRSTKPENLKRLIDAFATLEVSQEKVEKYIDKTVNKFTAEDVLTLRGVYNLIDQGESTVEEVFERKPANDESPEKTESVPGAPSIEEVVDGNEQRAVEGEPEATPEAETQESKKPEPVPQKPESPKKGARLL